MSIPKVFEQPLSLWEPLLGNENLWGALGNPFRTQDGTGDMAFLPPCDITEEKNAFNIHVDLPGIEKKDINVTLQEGILHIEAESSSVEENKEGDKVIRSERRYGKQIRRFNLGRQVSDNDVKASFKNGVLRLQVPKSKPVDAACKKIAVH